MSERAKDILQFAADYYHQYLLDHIGEPIIDIFVKRNQVSIEAIHTFRLGIAPDRRLAQDSVSRAS
jgi:DNA primase